MSEMFIDTIQARYPDRVLRGMDLAFMGFTAYFDLPNKSSLKLSIHAYAKGNEKIEVYETALIYNRSKHLADPHADSRIIAGSDALPVLAQWLRIALGGEECGYEGSFAEYVLANGVQRQEVTA